MSGLTENFRATKRSRKLKAGTTPSKIGSVSYLVGSVLDLYRRNGDQCSLHLETKEKNKKYLIPLRETPFNLKRAASLSMPVSTYDEYTHTHKVKWSVTDEDEKYVVKVSSDDHSPTAKKYWKKSKQEQATYWDIFGVDVLIGHRNSADASGLTFFSRRGSDVTDSGADSESLPSQPDIDAVEPTTKIYTAIPKLGKQSLNESLDVRSHEGRMHHASARHKSRSERLEMALKMALNIAALHAHGKIHTDIKPGNFVEDNGDIWAIDFTDNATTANYKAPEIDPDKHVCATATQGSDIYTLGLIFASLLPEEKVFHLYLESAKENNPILGEERHQCQTQPASEPKTPARNLLENMLDQPADQRSDIDEVVCVLSQELNDELTQHPDQAFESPVHYSAPQARLVLQAHQLYLDIVVEKQAAQILVRSLSNPEEGETETEKQERTRQIELAETAAGSFQAIAVDLQDAIQNRRDKYLCVETFTDIADRLEAASQNPLVIKARELAESPDAQQASRILNAQAHFQPLLQQLTSEIARLSIGSKFRVQKGRGTIDALNALKSRILADPGVSEGDIAARKKQYMADYGDASAGHKHRDSITFKCSTDTLKNFKKFQKEQASQTQGATAPTSSPFADVALGPSDSSSRHPARGAVSAPSRF